MECRPVITSVDPIGHSACLLSVCGLPVGEPGQSCRLYPNVMNSKKEYADIPLFYTDEQHGISSFLFTTEHEICHALASLSPGEAIAVEGPCGTPLPRFYEDILLIGEGVACAPLYGLAVRHRQSCPRTRTIARLLFAEASAMSQLLGELFRAVCDEVTIRFGKDSDACPAGLDVAAAQVCYVAAAPGLLARVRAEAQTAGTDLYIVMQQLFSYNS